jgi:hypothetical protein
MFDGNIVYDKRDFTIWEIEASVVNPFDKELRYVVSRWPAKSDMHVLSEESLHYQFYSPAEYKAFYEAHKDCIVDAPYELTNTDSHGDVHDEKLTFIHLITDDRFLYRYEYENDEGKHSKLIKLYLNDLSRYSDNVNGLFQMVYGITEFMEKPVNEW